VILEDRTLPQLSQREAFLVLEYAVTGHRLTTSRSVIYKLLGFTLAMVVAPIGTYFMTVNMLFKGLWDVLVKRNY
jgi:VMA21-like domain